MSFEIATRDLLRADATLQGFIPGGMYAYGEDTDHLGINRSNTSAAYDTNGLLKGTILVKDRTNVADGGIKDDLAQIISARQVQEIYFYIDRSRGLSAIDSARKRVWTLLHGKRISGFKIRWFNDIMGQHDSEMEYASVIRSDYTIINMMP